MVKTKLLFIIIGDDRSGKTTLQKLLIEKICGYSYDKLPVNKLLQITHPEIKRKYQTVSFGNRSYQEKKNEYGSVDEYFQNHFQDADIAFISSHLSENDISQMIINGKKKYFNVYGLFLTNSIQANPTINANISLLDWDERFIGGNDITSESNQIDKQLEILAQSLVLLLINRLSIS